MIFDTHAHYDDDAFDEDRDTLLGEIFSSGICCITDVGASVKSSKSAVALSKKWPQIYAAVGVHPDSTADMTEEDIKGEFKHGILKLFVPKKEAKPAVETKKYVTIEG